MKGILLPRYVTKPKGGEAEPHMWTAKAEDLAKNPESSEGLLRGRGNGTSRRRTTEQERPSCVILQWMSEGDKAKPKPRRAQRESEGVIVPRKAETAELRRGKDPCFGRASAWR